MAIEDKLNIKLNQNIWVLVVCLGGLGLAEYFHLPRLFSFSTILSLGSTISVLITLAFYTANYCKNKS